MRCFELGFSLLMMPFPKGRPTSCAIDLAALRWNFRQVKKKVGPGIKILSVIKADAYGHGAGGVAKSLEAEGSDAFGVATAEEGMELRKEGIRSPILVLAGTFPEQFEEISQNRLTPAICEPDMLQRLENLGRKKGISIWFHLKVDTGMGRIGFQASEVDHWIPPLRHLRALKLEGIFSHFSSAENVHGAYTKKQLKSFQQLIRKLKSSGCLPPLVHMANSAAVLTLPQAFFNMVRPGLMLYGIAPSPELSDRATLKPVLSWKTRILQIKRLPSGSSVSYGQTFVTSRESVVGTIPVGYADGYSRLLSNRGFVLVRGKRAPVIGRVCMDLTMVDLTDIGGVRQGDEVVLLGQQGDETILADEMAGWAETISYEILTSISSRVPRIHYVSKEA